MKIIPLLITFIGGWLILPEEVWACSAGSAAIFEMPITVAYKTYGLSVLAFVVLEAVLFQKLFRMGWKQSGLIMFLANMCSLVLCFIFMMGHLMFWGLFLIMGAFFFPIRTAIIIQKEAYFIKHKKIYWWTVIILCTMSFPILKFVSGVGHSLVHRGAHLIIGTPKEYLFYLGLVFYGLFTTIVFEEFLVRKFLKKLDGVYWKLAAINILPQIFLVFMCYR